MTASTCLRSLLASLVLGAAFATSATAQYEEPPPSPAYALTGVTVVRPDGTRMQGVNLVVRAGLIQALGADIEIPADAEVLEGDSLFVYPGLVDAHGEVSVEWPEVDRDGVVAWNAPREVQGFTPHRRLADYLTQTGSDGKSQREKGVVLIGAHPDEGFMSGQGSSVLLRMDTDDPRQLIANPSLGAAASFRSARGAYPSTLYGVIASIRQAFFDASRHSEIRSRYASNATRMTVPEWDPDYEVLNEIAARRMTVWFAADDDEDIRRVLSLSEEFNFRPILVGAGEAWELAPELARRRIPVVVNVDFDDPDHWDPEADTGEVALTPEAAVEKERLENRYANAGRLAQAGVQVSLSTGGSGDNLVAGARKAVEYGLSESDALRALTSNPASLLGVASVSPLIRGGPATFTVMSGPIFSDDSGVEYTFVEGSWEKGRGGRRAGGGDAAAPASVAGTWEVEMSAQGATFGGTLELTQDGEEVSGTLVSDAGEGPVTGSYSDGTITFTFSAGGFSVQFTGTVSGNEMSGTGSGGGFTIDFSGEREDPGQLRSFLELFGGTLTEAATGGREELR